MLSRASAEPYVRQFSATVERATDDSVFLDSTYFYPEGGGQPADRGTVDGVAVTDVTATPDGVRHGLADPSGFEPGDAVDCAIDPAFRTYCMRAHTASHVLYGAGRRLFEDLGYGGFGITEEKVRVDLSTPTEIDDEALVELERLTNRAVWDSLEVSWEQYPREEALAREDVAFNTKTEEGIAGDTVRLVTVEGWDVAACGGTHVRNTREIGPVIVLERSNPGEGLTRVEFAVGPAAIRRRAADRESAMAAARALDTRVRDLPDAVARLREERRELAEEAESLRETVLESRIADLREGAVRKDGRTWIVGTLPDLDANELSDRAGELVDDADVAALASEDGQYLAVATNGEPDAGDVVEEVTDEFGGGGGGSPTVAQAGGLGAGADELVSFLRE